MRTLVLALCLPAIAVGCDPAETPSGDSGAAVDLPSEYSYTPPEESAVEVDLAELEVALAAVLPKLRELDARPVIDAYNALMDTADGSCPAWYENEGNTFWYSDCTAETGTSFEGYGFTYAYEDIDAYGDGGVWNGDQLYGLSTLESSDGTYLHVAGSAYDLVGSYVFETYSYSVFQMGTAGSAVYEGPDTDGSWLSTTVDPDLAFYAYVLPEYDMRYMVMDGQVSGLESLDPALSSLDLDTVTYADELAGWPCAEELGGTIAVRASDGTWIDIVFDIEVGDEAVLVGDCDGCGAASRGAEYLGEVCLDPTPLIDFGDAPW